MRCINTDSRGKAIFQTKSGTYFGLDDDEIQRAIIVLMEVRDHREANLPRKYVDSRRNY